MIRFPDRLRTAQAAGLGGLAVATVWFAAVVAAPDAAAQCSVFSRHPCAPTTCSVFRHRPCIPEFDFPLGENLQLTINSAAEQRVASAEPSDHEGRDQNDKKHKLDNIRELFAALRACWVPPAESDAKPGMEMSVRFAFKRDGEIIGTPRVTYVTPDTPEKVRDHYHTAITQALERCTPMHFTRGMGGAIAGRPIAIRFVDNRKAQ